MNDWASSPSPPSPTTPDYLMTPSPMIVSSPASSFAAGFGTPFDDVLDKSFNDFSSPFSSFDCGNSQAVTLCDGDNMYPDFGDRYSNVPLVDLDLEFSTFMNSIPQYAM